MAVRCRGAGCLRPLLPASRLGPGRQGPESPGARRASDPGAVRQDDASSERKRSADQRLRGAQDVRRRQSLNLFPVRGRLVTTLGSARRCCSVNDIDRCAAKCRSIQRCAGFPFNGAGPRVRGGAWCGTKPHCRVQPAGLLIRPNGNRLKTLRGALQGGRFMTISPSRRRPTFVDAHVHLYDSRANRFGIFERKDPVFEGLVGRLLRASTKLSHR